VSERRGLLLAGLLLSMVFRGVAETATPIPQLSLEGTGRVCWGHLVIKKDRLRWTNPFNTCSSQFKVLSQNGMD
jgi:hypothetical protein